MDNGDDPVSSEELIRAAHKASAQPPSADEDEAGRGPDEAGTSVSDGSPETPFEDLDSGRVTDVSPPVAQDSPLPPTREDDPTRIRRIRTSRFVAAGMLAIGAIVGAVGASQQGIELNPTFIITDVVLIVALVAGQDWAVGWTLIRAGLGTILSAVGVFGENDLVVIALLAGFAVPLFIVLIGAPSPRRVSIGIAVFVAAAVGFIVIEVETDPVAALEVADCFDDPGFFTGEELIEVSRIDPADCEEPHDMQVVGSFEYTVSLPPIPGGVTLPAEEGEVEITGITPRRGARYPGEDVLDLQATEKCPEYLESFAGITYGEASLDLAYFFPLRDSWEDSDDRTITCLAYHADLVPLTGTLEGRGDEYPLPCFSEQGEPVSCETSHFAQMYVFLVHDAPPEAAYPGPAQLDSMAQIVCEQRFESWAGSSLNNTSLVVNWFSPDRVTWEQGDRLIACLVTDSTGGQLMGSARGSGL